MNAVTVVQIDKTTRAFFQDTKATPRRKMSAGNDNQQRMFRLYKNGIKVSKPKNEEKEGRSMATMDSGLRGHLRKHRKRNVILWSVQVKNQGSGM